MPSITGDYISTTTATTTATTSQSGTSIRDLGRRGLVLVSAPALRPRFPVARKEVTTAQKNKDVLHALRPSYAHNADSLIAVSHVVAVHFQTIAAADNYWRE
jgi:Hexameric tyrosine-coordinated heme protein (HTHP)